MRGNIFVPLAWGVLIHLSLAHPAPAAELGGEQVVAAPGGWNIGVSADFVYATREEGDNYIILQDSITGETIVDSDDLSFGWEPGLDARVNVTNGKYGGGVRFFGGFDFDDKKQVTTSPVFDFPTIPPLFGTGIATGTVDYESSLDSVELNISRAVGARGAVFIGVRSVMLDDQLTTGLNFGGANVATVLFEADTFAIGPQIGGEFHFGDRVFADIDGRIGALSTDSDLNMSVTQEIGPAFAAAGDQSNWTAVAEGGIAVGFKLGQVASLRAGYRVLYLSDVPTAPSIIDKSEVVPEDTGGRGRHPHPRRDARLTSRLLAVVR